MWNSTISITQKTECNGLTVYISGREYVFETEQQAKDFYEYWKN